MKTFIIISIVIFATQQLLAQDRIASNVSFKSGEETIEGILIQPHSEGKMPAVVFQQGSGPYPFDGVEKEAWGPHKYYIEDLLLEQGYAILYCNKRGLGNSTGNWKKNDFFGRADDAYAAVEYLKTRSDIDTFQIGMTGHSQGGWVAQLAASQHDDIAFVLSLAGPTVGVKAQTSMYDSLMYICNGYSGKKLKKKMFKYHKRKRFAANIGKILPFIKSAHYWHLIIDYNHENALRNITCPTLLLFAEHDVNVPPEQNLEHLNEVFDNKPPSNYTIKVMKGGQHAFYKVDNRCVDWETAVKQPFDPVFKNEIRSWLESL